MKVMKKSLAILISFCMISAFTCIAFAEDGYIGTFEIMGGEATITTYTTSTYTSGGEENQMSATARNSATGEIDVSGEGQINFTVNPAEGYEVAGVAVAGSYKNLKTPADTGLANTYRITKINSNLTITVTLQETVTEEETDESTVITFTDSEVTISGSKSGVSVSGTVVTVSEPGTYTFTGKCSDGSIVVAKNAGDVELVLAGLDLKSQSYETTEKGTTPISTKSNTSVTITAAQNTVNTLEQADFGAISPKSCVNASGDLIIGGTGTLNIIGNNKNGIKSDTNLTISDLTLNVTSADNCLSADNILTVTSGTITATSKQGDCLKSNPDVLTEVTLGQIRVSGGTLNLTADANDGIQALSLLTIDGGNFNIKTGGGYKVTYSESDEGSYKGIKSDDTLIINGGTFKINSADDAVHTNNTIEINGGSFDIYTGDDGIHADSNIVINDGDILINACYEGIEAENITINGSSVYLVASDDGINICGGNDNSGNRPMFGGRGGFPSSATDGVLTINGGYIHVVASGDGLDSNGSIVMNGGTVIVSGPTSNGDAAIDYDGSFAINGGVLLAVGSSGMLQTPSGGSQKYIKSTFGTQKAGTAVCVKDSNGNALIAFKSTKSFSSVVFSSPDLATGSYSVSIGGTIDGNDSNGVYINDFTYTNGSEVSTSVSSQTTKDDNIFAKLLNLLYKMVELLKKLFLELRK